MADATARAKAEAQSAFLEAGGEKSQSALVRQVRRALRNRHAQKSGRLPEWCYFEELTIGSSWIGPRRHRRAIADNGGRDFDPTTAGQRLDAFAVARFQSANARRVAYEIKVSRADFLHELKDPDKRAAGLAVSNEFYFVAPKNLIEAHELPEDCGLIEVDDVGRTRIKVKAPWRESEITAALLVAVAKAAS